MSKLSTLFIALSTAALFAGSAQAQTPTERTRAEVIAELKAAVESGEQQAMALRMEGVGDLLPAQSARRDTMFAKRKLAKKLSAKAESANASL